MHTESSAIWRIARARPGGDKRGRTVDGKPWAVIRSERRVCLGTTKIFHNSEKKKRYFIFVLEIKPSKVRETIMSTNKIEYWRSNPEWTRHGGTAMFGKSHILTRETWTGRPRKVWGRRNAELAACCYGLYLFSHFCRTFFNLGQLSFSHFELWLNFGSSVIIKVSMDEKNNW